MIKNKKSQYRKKRAYLIGIKGVGMTALAQILKANGYVVSGSDTHEKFFTDAVLKRHHIPFVEGFSARHVPKHADLVVASSAYDKKNPEVHQAHRLGHKVYSYAETLSKFFNEKEGIAVCGSHGKTTTSALLGYVFEKAGLKPSVMVGSEVSQFRGNALVGKGVHFIVEADEYQNKMQHLRPKTILLTNIDYDHPDFFKTPKLYREAFRKFIRRLPENGLLVACHDDPEVRKILSSTPACIVTYGLHAAVKIQKLKNKWEVRNTRVQHGRWHFDVFRNGKKFGKFLLCLVGEHNVLNALGVIALASTYGISKHSIQRALASFRGTRRRFEYVGAYKGALLIDDYAHHPTEIRATLKTARALYPKKRIIAVFHPHTYSRTRALLDDFSQSFGDADKVIVLDVYGSAREKPLGDTRDRRGRIGSREMVRRAKKFHKDVCHIPTIHEAASFLQSILKKDDVLLMLGAGDVWKLTHVLTSNNSTL